MSIKCRRERLHTSISDPNPTNRGRLCIAIYGRRSVYSKRYRLLLGVELRLPQPLLEAQHAAIQLSRKSGDVVLAPDIGGEVSDLFVSSVPLDPLRDALLRYVIDKDCSRWFTSDSRICLGNLRDSQDISHDRNLGVDPLGWVFQDRADDGSQVRRFTDQRDYIRMLVDDLNTGG